VYQFLKQLNLAQYCKIFSDNGFDDLDTLKGLKESSLVKMQVLEGHQGKILRKVKEVIEGD
jgi:hypothetical protein